MESFANKRRARLEIIADILAASRDGVKKTHLMLQCSMSFTQLKEYLDLILKTNLAIVQNDGPHLLLKTSHKGKKFLKAYEGLKALTK